MPRRAAAPASRSPAGATSAWTSTSSGRLPSSVAATTLPGRRPSCSARNARAGIGDLAQARLAHLEHAELVGRSEAVLRGAQEAHDAARSPPSSRTASTRCSRVFGPGDRAVLRDVADEDHGDPLALRQLHQPERGLADLADAAGRPVELVDGRWSGSSRRRRSAGRRRARRSTIRADLARRRGPRIASPRRRRAARAARRGAGPGPSTPRPWRTATPPSRPRRDARRRPGGGASTCRPPARRRSGRSEPGTIPPPRTRSSSPMPTGGAASAGSRDAASGAGAHDAGRRTGRRGARPRLGAGRRRSRRGCSRRRTSGTGPPSGGSRRRRTGRRSGSGRPAPCPRAVATQTSTGVFGSAAWMSRPALGVRVDHDRRARLVLAEQEVLGEDVLDQVLDRPAERTRAECRVLAELDDVVLRRLGDLEAHALRLQLVADPLRA